MKSFILAGALTAAIVAEATSAAPVERTFCVFDPIGAAGPLYQIMKEDLVPALKWGVKLKLQAYTDENVAASDFRAGQCDQVLLTGARARSFNKFTGSLEAVGGLRDLKEVKTVLTALTQPKAAKYMMEGDTEVVGILPAGAVRLFMRDKTVDTVEELQGLRFGVMDFDKAAITMVRKIGASVVPVNVATFAGKFNNGSVDVIYAPVVAYEPLELYKGIGTEGAIFDYTVAQMTFQIVSRADAFPEGYGQKYREHILSKFDNGVKLITAAEAKVPESAWVIPSPDKIAGYDTMLQSARIDIRDAGIYHAKTLTLMRKVRCKSKPSEAECTTKVE